MIYPTLMSAVEIAGKRYPENLRAMVSKKACQKSYSLGFAYYIKMAYTRWVLYPAVVSDDPERVIFTTDPDLIQKVLDRMPKRGTPEIRECVFYLHKDMEVGYQMSDTMEPFRKRLPIKILTNEEFRALEDEEYPFKWINDVVGEEDMEKPSLLEDFRGFKPAKNT